MKFKCSQQALSRALNIVSKAANSRTTIPILKGILIEADETGNLKMVASDLDITIEEVIKVETLEKGSVVVQAKLFSDIIRKLPGKELEVEVAEGKVIIRCMNSEFSIVGMPADEFPEIKNEEEGSGCIEFDSELLKSMIRKTSFAASIDESKGVITGILIDGKCKRSDCSRCHQKAFIENLSSDNAFECFNEDIITNNEVGYDIKHKSQCP